jgi:hypothetical protein
LLPLRLKSETSAPSMVTVADGVNGPSAIYWFGGGVKGAPLPGREDGAKEDGQREG